MSLTVRPEKAPPTVLEWRLLVLPFPLSRPADKHWGTWLDGFPPVGGLYAPAERGRTAAAEVDRLARADIADYRDHGFDLVLLELLFRREGEPRRHVHLRSVHAAAGPGASEAAGFRRAGGDLLRIHLPEPGIRLRRAGKEARARHVQPQGAPGHRRSGAAHPATRPSAAAGPSSISSRSTSPATTRRRTAIVSPRTSWTSSTKFPAARPP